jgi:hypothetical protein
LGTLVLERAASAGSGHDAPHGNCLVDEGISGADLANRLRRRAERLGVGSCRRDVVELV